MDATAGVFTTLIALAVLVPCCVWVLRDARARSREGRPVVLQVGSWEIDRAEVWLLLCVLLFVVAFPAYLVARRAGA